MSHSLLSVSDRIGHTGHYSLHNHPLQPNRERSSLKFIDLQFCPSIMYRDIILASHESLWTEQGGHLKRTVFEMVTVHLELSHCTVPASQILLRSFSSRCASFLISLLPRSFFLSHAILPSAILLALLLLLPLPLTPPRPFLPRSPTFLGGFCARCILRRSASSLAPFHFVQLLQALECRIMSFVASGCSYF